MADTITLKPPPWLKDEPNREVEVDGAAGEFNRLLVAGWRPTDEPQQITEVSDAS